MCNLLLEGIRQGVSLSECPTFLYASVRICIPYFVGVLVDLEAQCLPVATILDGVGVNWEQGSPFLAIPVSFLLYGCQ